MGGVAMITQGLVRVLIVVLACATAACGSPGSDELPSPSAGSNCFSLTGVSQPQSTYTSATEVEATGTVPAHCRVELTIAPSIKVVVALPRAWNGNFQAVGGGGFNGTLPAIDLAVDAGYAAAATDTGHVGTDLEGHFVRNPDGSFNTGLAEDFAYRANHEMTVRAKSLIQTHYGRGPKYSYWNGCSTGGREGLMEAQRFPDDYDGVLAAAPAINMDRILPAMTWPQIAMHQSGNLLPWCKLDAVTTAAIHECDDLDGVMDGVIADPGRCAYDPHDLVGTTFACGAFTTKDADVIVKIWEGPRSSQGSFLWHGLERGAPLDVLADRTGLFPIPNDWIRFWVLENPDWDYRTTTYSDLEMIFERSEVKFRDLLGTDNPDLSAFRSRGGKLLMWHGWNDQLIFPRGTIDYYDRLVATMGAQQTRQFARLFMAPGVEHCGGGPGPDAIDAFDKLLKWVESGQAPTQVLASEVVAGRTVLTRPLCSYPQVARYTGRGSADDAENFRCSD
jgi:hypothetical protein